MNRPLHSFLHLWLPLNFVKLGWVNWLNLLRLAFDRVVMVLRLKRAIVIKVNWTTRVLARKVRRVKAALKAGAPCWVVVVMNIWNRFRSFNKLA